MWKLHRYYYKEVVLTAALTFVVLFGIAMISFVYRGIDRVADGNLISVALITLLFAADTLPHLLAISVLLGTALTVARAASEREMTAIRAAGISLRTPMTAAVLVGLAATLVALLALHYVIPWAHFHKYRFGAEALREFVQRTRLAADQIHIKGVVMTWDHEEDRRFHGVVIFRGEEILLADTAWFEVEGELLTLHLEGASTPEGQAAVTSSKLMMNLREITEPGQREEGDRDLPTDQILAEIERGVQRDPVGATYTIHRRECYALLPAILAPLGFCIGLLVRDRGRAAALLLSMVPVLVFYACDFLSRQLLRALDAPAVAFLPAGVLLALSTPMCWRVVRS
jgi:lipopolysaccharide export LptBFGC system permease protein LptF